MRKMDPLSFGWLKQDKTSKCYYLKWLKPGRPFLNGITEAEPCRSRAPARDRREAAGRKDCWTAWVLGCFGVVDEQHDIGGVTGDQRRRYGPMFLIEIIWWVLREKSAKPLGEWGMHLNNVPACQAKRNHSTIHHSQRLLLSISNHCVTGTTPYWGWEGVWNVVVMVSRDLSACHLFCVLACMIIWVIYIFTRSAPFRGPTFWYLHDTI